MIYNKETNKSIYNQKWTNVDLGGCISDRPQTGIEDSVKVLLRFRLGSERTFFSEFSRRPRRWERDMLTSVMLTSLTSAS